VASAGPSACRSAVSSLSPRGSDSATRSGVHAISFGSRVAAKTAALDASFSPASQLRCDLAPSRDGLLRKYECATIFRFDRVTTQGRL
jgi:hypothetical protein